MNNQVSNALLNKQNFEETTVADWQNLSNDYPAFSLSQLFLAKKLKSVNEKDYVQQLPKTALRFNNIFWLSFLLQDEKIELEITDKKENLIQEEEIIPEKNQDDAIAESRLASMLQAQAANFNKPVSAEEKLAIETEPLYKTDYFASQGIIFTKSQDALGNKVKKFTDWLKDIKQNTSGVPQLHTTEAEEKEAANQAAASLKLEEVVTEPMADVLLAQNKKPQAIEIYKKLSLIYPEKSAYFAAKINSLQ